MLAALAQGRAANQKPPTDGLTAPIHMNDTFPSEIKLPLSQIAKQIPDFAGVSPRSLTRWATRGVRGVRLEVVRIGGTMRTSVEAARRFLAALNTSTSNPTTPAPRSPHERSKASARAAAELEAAGC